MSGDDVAADVQAQARAGQTAGDCSRRAVETVEYARQILSRYAQAAIAYRHFHHAVAPQGGHSHSLALRAVLERVANQVGQHLLDATALPDTREWGIARQ